MFAWIRLDSPEFTRGREILTTDGQVWTDFGPQRAQRRKTDFRNGLDLVGFGWIPPDLRGS
jgi:hypothetical protein